MQQADRSPGPPIGGVFRCAMPVRWGDLDALKHVNNTLFFRYLEEARVQMFAQAGMRLASNKSGVLAHASCDFLKPILYPATVVVSLILARVGRSSLEMDTLIECENEPGVPYAKGKNILVGVDAQTGQSLPWTPEELERLGDCFEL